MLLVSILMPAYNADAFIGDAIASCIAQTYQNWDLCVAVDPDCEDDTLGVAGRWAEVDSRVNVAVAPHNGYALGMNAALAMARGQVIARLDADDSQNADRIELELHILQNGGKDIATCGMCWMSEDGKALDAHPVKGFDLEPYLNNQGICGASVLAWRRVWNTVGGYDPEYNWSADSHWNLRVARAGFAWGHVPQPLYYQRRHPGQMTARTYRQQRETWDRVVREFRAAQAGTEDGD